MTLTLTFDPTKLRVRTVQEGSFMRAGGVDVAFTQQVNGRPRRHHDGARGDATGASGTGSARGGPVRRDCAGRRDADAERLGTGPGGTAMGLQFRPVTVTVQQ